MVVSAWPRSREAGRTLRSGGRVAVVSAEGKSVKSTQERGATGRCVLHGGLWFS